MEAIFDQYIETCVNLAIFNIFGQNMAINSNAITEMEFNELTSVYSVPLNQNKSIGNDFLINIWKHM